MRHTLKVAATHPLRLHPSGAIIIYRYAGNGPEPRGADVIVCRGPIKMDLSCYNILSYINSMVFYSTLFLSVCTVCNQAFLCYMKPVRGKTFCHPGQHHRGRQINAGARKFPTK